MLVVEPELLFHLFLETFSIIWSPYRIHYQNMILQLVLTQSNTSGLQLDIQKMGNKFIFDELFVCKFAKKYLSMLAHAARSNFILLTSTISGTDEDWLAGVCDVDGCGYDSIEGSVDRLDCVKETDVDMADRVGEEEQWDAWVDVDRVEIALVGNTSPFWTGYFNQVHFLLNWKRQELLAKHRHTIRQTKECSTCFDIMQYLIPGACNNYGKNIALVGQQKCLLFSSLSWRYAGITRIRVDHWAHASCT